MRLLPAPHRCRLFGLLTALGCLVPVFNVAAQPAVGGPLDLQPLPSGQRLGNDLEAENPEWREPYWGLGLAMPNGMKQIWPTLGGVATFEQGDATVFLFIRRFRVPAVATNVSNDPNDPLADYTKRAVPDAEKAPQTTAEAYSELLEKLWIETGFVMNDRVIASEQPVAIAQRNGMQTIIDGTAVGEGVKNLLNGTDIDQGQPMRVHQIVFKIDPNHIVLAMAVANDNPAAADAAAQSLIQGISLQNPVELSKHRNALLDASEALLEQTNRQTWVMDLPQEQYFRWVEQGKEVGAWYQAEFVPQNDPNNVAYKEAGRNVSDAGVVDFNNTFQLSLDGKQELWQRLATDHQRNSTLRVQSDETGASTPHQLAVSRRSRTTNQNPVWEIPPVAYLSQTDAMMLLRRLPRQDAEYAFYTYDSVTGRINLLTVEVKTLVGGRYHIILHRRPESREEIWTFDRSGNWVSRHLSNGTVLLPCSKQDIETIWANQNDEANAPTRLRRP